MLTNRDVNLYAKTSSCSCSQEEKGGDECKMERYVLCRASIPIWTSGKQPFSYVHFIITTAVNLTLSSFINEKTCQFAAILLYCLSLDYYLSAVLTTEHMKTSIGRPAEGSAFFCFPEVYCRPRWCLSSSSDMACVKSILFPRINTGT